MELDELKKRLLPFCRAKYQDDDILVTDVHKMPGHAGFAYGFTAQSGEKKESWFLRMPPPGVKWKGTADVLRQVAILNALDGTDIPHCSVKWSGDDLEWFGRPYFIVPQLQGDVIRMEPGGWEENLSDETLHRLGRQVMTALAKIHKIDWEKKTPSLGPPIPFDKDVTRWDRFVGMAADPDRLAKAPEVRKHLLDKIPTETPVGVFHGDFQFTNMFCSYDGNLLAVVDWELVGIGATLNDVGWAVTFSDVEAWSPKSGPPQAAGRSPGHAGPVLYRGLRRTPARSQLVQVPGRLQVCHHIRPESNASQNRQTARPALGGLQALH